MRASIASAVIALLVTAAPGCSQREPDACGRAFDRLARIHAARGQRSPRPKYRDEALEACRRGGTASYDPTVRCAMDSPTDDAAAACIDQFIHHVIPSWSPGDPPHPGKGLNPLLGEP